MIRNHPSAAALVVHALGEVAAWEAQQVLDEAAWDAADELAPYRPADPGLAADWPEPARPTDPEPTR